MRKKRIKLMGKTIKIEHIKNLLKEGNLYGECLGSLLLIRIDADLNEKDYELTLKHEILHMIFYISGITFMLTSGLEETIVRCIENNFLDLKL